MKKFLTILCLSILIPQMSYSENTQITDKITNNSYTADYFIKNLQLEKHIEGGSFKRVYASKNMMPVNGYKGKRHYSTSIYFLIDGNDFSAFHRLKSDEIWSFNFGSPITIYVLDENGKLNTTVLGDPKNPVYQTTLFANQWFAAEPNDKSSFTLISCFVSPGFEYVDFELAKKAALIKEYPNYSDLINRLTRS